MFVFEIGVFVYEIDLFLYEIGVFVYCFCVATLVAHLMAIIYDSAILQANYFEVDDQKWLTVVNLSSEKCTISPKTWLLLLRIVQSVVQ